MIQQILAFQLCEHLKGLFVSEIFSILPELNLQAPVQESLVSLCFQLDLPYRSVILTILYFFDIGEISYH